MSGDARSHLISREHPQLDASQPKVSEDLRHAILQLILDRGGTHNLELALELGRVHALDREGVGVLPPSVRAAALLQALAVGRVSGGGDEAVTRRSLGGHSAVTRRGGAAAGLLRSAAC